MKRRSADKGLPSVTRFRRMEILCLSGKTDGSAAGQEFAADPPDRVEPVLAEVVSSCQMTYMPSPRSLTALQGRL